jgi:uncharacterized protein
MRRTWVLSLVMAPQERWSKLSKAWAPNFLSRYEASPPSGSAVLAALERTLPLLEDNPAAAVPFVCRYRTDAIAPLTTAMIHQLSEYLQTHTSLESLRQKLLAQLPPHEDEALTLRVETSICKTELEDLYAPFKPPAKGSLEDRIKKEHPALVEAIDTFWCNPEDAGTFQRSFQPKDAAVTVLANRIASDPATMDACQAYTHQSCRVKVGYSSSKDHKKEDEATFATYDGFNNALKRLRDHQVLAIRRGVDKKALKLSFEMESDPAEYRMRQALGGRMRSHHGLWKDAIYDAWSRLLRKRCTTRAWKTACESADERAIAVFCENLRKALLAPPPVTSTAVLGLDPGFRAGIKTALLDSNGQLVSPLTSVKFIPNRETGKYQLVELLKALQEHQGSTTTNQHKLVVALGNGHGTQEARKLVVDASDIADIPIDIRLVNEAGASVWSVTPAANREFPDEPAAAVAAISIARRYQNPLAELVKIPPRSLGLGMYQHDFSEKILDGKLHATSVDCVAAVGVDVNSCSLEILEKVPGLTKTLAGKVIKARPLQSRNDLLKVSGLGPKTFEHCAAFIRVEGTDDLDRTMCHPESYELARYLLRKMKWNLNDPNSVGGLPLHAERRATWNKSIVKACDRYHVSEDRVLLVMDHLIRSITHPDPRLGNDNAGNTSSAASETRGCSPLSPNLVPLEALRKACPVRKVLGYVRNIVDFGVFVDFGGDNDGLVHRSKLGPVSLQSLMVGQEIGIDILGVSANKRITLSLTGLDLPSESLDNHASRESQKRTPAKRKKAPTSSTRSSAGSLPSTAKRQRRDSTT